MKIVDVTLAIFQLPPAGDERLANLHPTPPPGDLGYLRVITDDGIEGQAFLGALDNPASMDGAQLIRFLKPVLIGRDPIDRERIHAQLLALSRKASYRTIGAVDVALWDIAGKAANMPIHRLLGSAQDRIPAYASSHILPDAEQYVRELLSLRDSGWTAFKIHPPKKVDLDIAVVEAVRSAAGDDFALMLDGGWAYRYPDALEVGKALQDAGYLWFEDPLGDEDIYNYVSLCQRLDIPIMATEYPVGGLDSYPSWITERATAMLRGDVAVKGGITTMVKTAHLAEAFHLPYEVHYGGNALGDIASLHLAVALRNCTYFEMLFPHSMHSYGLAEQLTIDDAGLVHAPAGPGLGVELDLELINRQTLEVWS